MKYDLIIRGGTVVDGSGAPAFVADVAVTADRIAAIGRLADAVAEREIDATGMVVSPASSTCTRTSTPRWAGIRT